MRRSKDCSCDPCAHTDPFGTLKMDCVKAVNLKHIKRNKDTTGVVWDTYLLTIFFIVQFVFQYYKIWNVHDYIYFYNIIFILIYYIYIIYYIIFVRIVKKIINNEHNIKKIRISSISAFTNKLQFKNTQVNISNN